MRRFARHLAARPERVMLLGVVLLLISFAVPGYQMWRGHWMRLMAKYDLIELLEAEKLFFAQYEFVPTPDSSEREDLRFGRGKPNREVMNILRGVDGVGNIGHSVNKKQVAFIAVAEARPGLSGIDAQGDFLDPWGHPYEMVLDATGDGNCFSRTTSYGFQSNRRMIAWSCGPDGTSDTRDDILSWAL